LYSPIWGHAESGQAYCGTGAVVIVQFRDAFVGASKDVRRKTRTVESNILEYVEKGYRGYGRLDKVLEQ
jgi:hypothetical protein